MDAAQAAVLVQSGNLAALQGPDEIAEKRVYGSQLAQRINCTRHVVSMHPGC